MSGGVFHIAFPFLGDVALVPMVAYAAVFAVAASPGFLALYRRLRRDKLLVNGERRRTLEYFAAHPGATVAQAAGALGVDYKTTLHHARVLRDFRLLRATRDGRLIRYEAVAPIPPAFGGRFAAAQAVGPQAP